MKKTLGKLGIKVISLTTKKASRKRTTNIIIKRLELSLLKQGKKAEIATFTTSTQYCTRDTATAII